MRFAQTLTRVIKLAAFSSEHRMPMRDCGLPFRHLCRQERRVLMMRKVLLLAGSFAALAAAASLPASPVTDRKSVV